MENLNLNEIFERNNILTNIKNILNNFSINNNSKKGIYIYGDNGIGKSKLILNFLKENNFDVLYYDNSIIRNKNLIENICSNNLSNRNIYSMLCEEERKIVIVIDDIDCMNCGDKNGIVTLVKLIREKKTKKQKLENVTNNPVICINGRGSDKKTLELMKVCNVFEIKSPTNIQLKKIISKLYPNIYKYRKEENTIIEKNILNFLDNNLLSFDKLDFYYKNDFIYKKFFDINFINTNLNYNNNLNIKLITKNILSNSYNFNDINKILESDRTIVSLLFHENIINVIDIKDLNIYLKILENFIFADYIDRIIFQKQIWQLTEYSYIIKIFYNNYILNKNNLLKNINIDKIIFTKVLTKYSSEYNNYIFIYSLLQNFLVDKIDIYVYFLNISELNINDIISKFKYVNINKLEIIRIIKFINYLITFNNKIKENYTNEIEEESIDYLELI
tara:strand:- start:320 stop:1660 length:1341 start_codon:yes stop_codon:yes gene_type:complete